eukprot:NODE_1693_length_784_cov_771.602721_g1416_i0.p1 GENE.NODE_1693_length_784_cov_771.602721_g1416_i0~~NODE_1693_length_784_cov_771.602721_g1416_i0.p1  ORF type:complete len:172 (-),score=64.54 NODE_1693_length_784_cov_771.602721_g1416_i0:218-733(-)
MRTPAERRYVQVGRVVLFVRGPEKNKLGVIVDIADQNRVLVEGPKPLGPVQRQLVNIKYLELTSLVVKGVQQNIHSKPLTALVEKSDVLAAWEKTAWAKKLAVRQAKRLLDDKGRWQLMRAKQQRSRLIKVAYFKAKRGDAPAKDKKEKPAKKEEAKTAAKPKAAAKGKAK